VDARKHEQLGLTRSLHLSDSDGIGHAATPVLPENLWPLILLTLSYLECKVELSMPTMPKRSSGSD
jgi:hypothetical protein